MKRKSISFADGKTGSAVPAKRASLEGQQRPKTARGARGGSASKNLRGRVGASGGSVYTPPAGKYSSNIGQVGELSLAILPFCDAFWIKCMASNSSKVVLSTSMPKNILMSMSS